MSGAARRGILPVRGRVLQEPGVLQPAGELGQRDLGLLTREPGAEAVVDAGEEAQMLVVLPLRVESVRIRKAVRVSVGGGQREYDARALRDSDIPDLDVVQCHVLRV